MTMLSFRIGEAEAAELQRWAEALGLDRSELLRDALHRHLVRLRSEVDAATWESIPLSDAEQSLEQIADWGPAEDWADWSNAAG
jgi:predicted transcriptional regulator